MDLDLPNLDLIADSGFSFSQIPLFENSQKASDSEADEKKLIHNLQIGGHLDVMNQVINQDAINSGQRPTSVEPALADFDGHLEFEMYAYSLAQERNNSNWVCSVICKRLFIKMGATVTLQFSWNQLLVDTQHELFIRATPVYTSPDFYKLPVLRCPVHRDVEANRDFDPAHVEHVLRCETGSPIYEKDPISGRLSVKVRALMDESSISDFSSQDTKCPIFNIDYKFVCQTSCAGGMDRRPIHVLFTLENANGDVLGRRIWSFRICSCVRRDLKREERDKDICEDPDDSKESNGKKLIIKKQSETEEDFMDRCFFRCLDSLTEPKGSEVKNIIIGRYHTQEEHPDPEVQAKWRKLF